MKVSIVIPTKNEPLISKLVGDIHKNIKKYEHEIIVVDKSDHAHSIRNINVIRQQSEGLGMAILEGVNHSTGDVIVTMDGDGSHDPKDLPKLIELSRKYDIIIGSRFMKGSRTEDFLFRKIVSYVFRKITSFVLGIKIKDSMSGFAVIRRKVYSKLKLNPRGYKINTEILYKSKKFGFKAIESPITFHKRILGKPKPKFKEFIRTLIFIFELRLGIR